MDVRDVPTTLVTGFLGAGKTTALLDLFRHRPDGARWAVLVNEFGEIGIDGAVLETGGLTVREVPGGCICCTSSLEMRVALVRVLRDVRPDRLLVEPTGLARPAAILDALRAPGLRDAVSLRATLGLVDPRRLDDPRFSEREGWQEHWQVADVLVATHGDVATDDQIARFRREADAAWPPKLEVAVTAGGRMDPRWLELAPSPSAPRVAAPHGEDVPARGWVWPPSTVFSRARLEDALCDLVRPGTALPLGALRVKGIFRTERVWMRVDGTADSLRFTAFDHRRDSRVEVIAPPDRAPDWGAVEAAFAGAMLRR